MMKKIFLITSLLIVSFLLTAAGFSCSSNNISASIGKEFTLPQGKTAVISGESLSIKFVEVTADSRCASDVVCIVAGEAKCLMLIKYLDSESSVTLTVNGSADSTQVFNKYTLKFNLQPYPVSTQQIKPSDYRLIMTVAK